MKTIARRLLVLLHDWAASALAWWLAYLLRFNFEPPASMAEEMTQTLPLVLALQAATFWLFGLYQGLWRYASLHDLRRIVLAAALSAALIPLLFWMLRIGVVAPRSVLLLDPILLLLIMGGNRLLYRLWKEKLLTGHLLLRGEAVLILGAGDAAVSLSRELQRSERWRAVGFLDDQLGRSSRSQRLNGIRVLGTMQQLPFWAEKLGVTQAILAMPAAKHSERKRVAELCAQIGLRLLTVPSFEDLMNGRVAVTQLRAVELDDLLGRDPVALDDAGLQDLLGGRVVLVTGAGGSIGSELCRQIARFTPQKLLLLESSEFALYNMEQEFTRKLPEIPALFLAGDIRDPQRLEEIFAQHHPHVVFHAAAYKHVPLMEQDNAWQALRNNVLGTWCVAEAARRYGAAKFVLISTDKAVNPTNVMGASKRLAEIVCQSLQQSTGTAFIMVRFGNVLGSNGSVIPKFREQIAQGGPVTVTHAEITRYFMLIPEAAQLVLQAGCMGKGGEIFVLDMGEPVKIVDLARALIQQSGFKEDEIRIEFTGLRAGEKLYEELLADSEHTLQTPHPKLRIAQARCAPESGVQALLDWLGGAPQSDSEVRSALKRWVPEYQPASA